jgi:flagellar protein FliT
MPHEKDRVLAVHFADGQASRIDRVLLMEYVGTACAATRDLMPPDDGQNVNTERCSMIQHYEAIAASSRRMLDAARRDDWDQVSREEDRCRNLISGLKQAGATGASPIGRRQRLALLRTMLADDAEIREISEPWLRQLEALLAGRGGRVTQR